MLSGAHKQLLMQGGRFSSAVQPARCFMTRPLQRSNLLWQCQMRSIITPIQMTDQTKSRQASSRKISTKLLCDISGTRYYESNEEIEYSATQNVRVFDENNVNIGTMTF